jgi:hypothetical protein
MPMIRDVPQRLLLFIPVNFLPKFQDPLITSRLPSLDTYHKGKLYRNWGLRRLWIKDSMIFKELSVAAAVVAFARLQHLLVWQDPAKRVKFTPLCSNLHQRPKQWHWRLLCKYSVAM